jgi:hypothetical protein
VTLLRASGEIDGNTVDMSAVTGTGDGNVPHGAALTRFTDAVMGDDSEELSSAREALANAVGEDGLVDSAAVISTFQKMDRFADSTGIPLDTATEMASRDLRADIGLDEFGSARNTPPPGFVQRVAARLIGPLSPRVIRYLGPITRRLAARRKKLFG